MFEIGFSSLIVFYIIGAYFVIRAKRVNNIHKLYSAKRKRILFVMAIMASVLIFVTIFYRIQALWLTIAIVIPFSMTVAYMNYKKHCQHNEALKNFRIGVFAQAFGWAIFGFCIGYEFKFTI